MNEDKDLIKKRKIGNSTKRDERKSESKCINCALVFLFFPIRVESKVCFLDKVNGTGRICHNFLCHFILHPLFRTYPGGGQ